MHLRIRIMLSEWKRIKQRTVHASMRAADKFHKLNSPRIPGSVTGTGHITVKLQTTLRAVAATEISLQFQRDQTKQLVEEQARRRRSG